MTFAQNTFRFTSNPKNAACPWAGKVFEAEGRQVAEHKHSTGRQVFFATLRKAQDDIKLSSFSFNENDELYEVQYLYITAEHSKALGFGNMGFPLGLDIHNVSPFDKFETENISEENRQLNGYAFRDFKSKEAIEAFKKFLQR
jgi:hypothetical protein